MKGRKKAPKELFMEFPDFNARRSPKARNRTRMVTKLGYSREEALAEHRRIERIINQQIARLMAAVPAFKAHVTRRIVEDEE